MRKDMMDHALALKEEHTAEEDLEELKNLNREDWDLYKKIP